MINYRDLNWYSVMDLIGDSEYRESNYDYFFNPDTGEISKVELYFDDEEDNFKVYINEVLMSTPHMPCRNFGDVYNLITENV